tara:strand:- start:17729 stop:18340 length:612 start_codon:yes stop_codon:yes gene_type:complete
MDILYYSNYCKHSQNVLQTLVKSNLSKKVSFISIDKRKLDPATNQMKIILENGSQVILPPNIKSVPCLLLVNKNFQVILGSDIVKHYHKDIKQNNQDTVQNGGEPSGYHLGISSGGTNIQSEHFTSYNLSPDELSAKGNSENRNLHNYVSVNNDLQLIQTPPDDYKPDKVSSDVTLDTLQQQRMDDVNMKKDLPPDINFSITN